MKIVSCAGIAISGLILSIACSPLAVAQTAASSEDAPEVQPRFFWGALIKFIGSSIFSTFGDWLGSRLTGGTSGTLPAAGFAPMQVAGLQPGQPGQSGGATGQIAQGAMIGALDAVANVLVGTLTRPSGQAAGNNASPGYAQGGGAPQYAPPFPQPYPQGAPNPGDPSAAYPQGGYPQGAYSQGGYPQNAPGQGGGAPYPQQYPQMAANQPGGGFPQQPGYPQQPQGFQPQPGYPAPQGYAQQPSYPGQQGNPQQLGYPTQPGYPAQPGYGQQSGNPPGYPQPQQTYPQPQAFQQQPGYTGQPGASPQAGYPQQSGYPQPPQGLQQQPGSAQQAYPQGQQAYPQGQQAYPQPQQAYPQPQQAYPQPQQGYGQQPAYPPLYARGVASSNDKPVITEKFVTPRDVVLGRPSKPLELQDKDANYQAVHVAIVVLDAQGKPAAVRSVKDGFRTGERFKLRVVSTFEGLVAIDNINPKGEQKRVYPDGNNVVAIPLGREVLIPLAADEWFELNGSTGQEQLVVAVRDRRAFGEAASVNRVFRQDEKYGSNFVQEVSPNKTFPVITQSLTFEHSL